MADRRVRPLDPLMWHPTRMGLQPNDGMCNAVIVAAPNAAFLTRWLENYREFKDELWDWTSVYRPWELARAHPEEIQIVAGKGMFSPSWYQPGPFERYEHDLRTDGRYL